MLGFLGRIIDSMSVKITLPITLLCRSATWFALYTIKDPTKWFFYLMIPLVHVMFFATILTSASYNAKMYPKDIRGMLGSVCGVCSAITGYFYLVFCNWLYQKSSRLPFLGCSVADILLAMSVIILVSLDKYGNVIKPVELDHEDSDDKNQTKSQEQSIDTLDNSAAVYSSVKG